MFLINILEKVIKKDIPDLPKPIRQRLKILFETKLAHDNKMVTVIAIKHRKEAYLN